MQYQISEKLWRYPGPGGWYFIRLDKKSSEHIRAHAPHKGWGSVRVAVVVGNTKWETSVFWEKQTNAYLLPMKASVRKSEDLEDSDVVSALVTVL